MKNTVFHFFNLMIFCFNTVRHIESDITFQCLLINIVRES